MAKEKRLTFDSPPGVDLAGGDRILFHEMPFSESLKRAI
jgi:hypothetical protein